MGGFRSSKNGRTSKSNDTSRSSAQERSNSKIYSANARKRKKNNKIIFWRFIVFVLLLAVFGGVILAIVQTVNMANFIAEPLKPTELGGLETLIDVNEEIILPNPPQFTEDGIVMQELENGAKMYERDGLTYLVINANEMLFCNKQFSVPKDYGNGITDEAQQAFDKMAAAAEKENHNIYIGSGFRSYDTQYSIHARYIENYGEEYTKSMSAEAGHSEHQTGFGMDIAGGSGYFLDQEFENTPEFKWLFEHAHEYGFILRYQKNKTWATGYIYEPWHYRYVGLELAQLFKDRGVTVEEYVGLPDGKPEEQKLIF